MTPAEIISLILKILNAVLPLIKELDPNSRVKAMHIPEEVRKDIRKLFEEIG